MGIVTSETCRLYSSLQFSFLPLSMSSMCRGPALSRETVGLSSLEYLQLNATPFALLQTLLAQLLAQSPTSLVFSHRLELVTIFLVLVLSMEELVLSMEEEEDITME